MPSIGENGCHITAQTPQGRPIRSKPANPDARQEKPSIRVLIVTLNDIFARPGPEGEILAICIVIGLRDTIGR